MEIVFKIIAKKLSHQSLITKSESHTITTKGTNFKSSCIQFYMFSTANDNNKKIYSKCNMIPNPPTNFACSAHKHGI